MTFVGLLGCNYRDTPIFELLELLGLKYGGYLLAKEGAWEMVALQRMDDPIVQFVDLDFFTYII